MKRSILLSTILLCCGLFVSCGDSGDEDSPHSSNSLESIVGNTLLLVKENGMKILAEHAKGDGVVIKNITVDYGKKNAPSYSYSVKDGNSANYQLTFVKKTYIPYYKDYVYSLFDINVDLVFTSSNKGHFSGIQIHNGAQTSISGTFVFDPKEEAEGDKETDEGDDQLGIHLSDCVVTDIGSSSVEVYGKVTLIGNAVIAERGFCIGTSPKPTQKNKCNSEAGEQNVLLEGLRPFTLYYIRQYAIVAGDIFYGNEMSITTATEGTIHVPGKEFMVDMGLSVKWAKGNLCVNSDGTGHIANTPGYIPPYRRYSETATEWDFFCWGDPSGIRTYETVRYPDYGSIPYQIAGTDKDIVHVKLGGEWRLPTRNEWKELIENCVCRWETSNGIAGLKIISHNGNSIFLPAGGWGAGSWIFWRGEKCQYWSGNFSGGAVSDEIHAFSFSFDKDGEESINTVGELYTHMFCIRPVSE